MATKISNNKINIKGKVINIGIDVHKVSWHLTAFSSGEIILALTISRPDYGKLKKVLEHPQGCLRRRAIRL